MSNNIPLLDLQATAPFLLLVKIWSSIKSELMAIWTKREALPLELTLHLIKAGSFIELNESYKNMFSIYIYFVSLWFVYHYIQCSVYAKASPYDQEFYFYKFKENRYHINQ